LWVNGFFSDAEAPYEIESTFIVGRKFVTLSCCALYFLSAQVERANTPDYASRLVQSNPVLPPVAEQDKRQHETRNVSETGGEKFRNFLAISVNLPTTFISWSHKVKSILAIPVIQKNCLTTAVYFEARSETALGQLAVATVVLNRVQNSNSSICGVVYKGANHFNACQFSFACDGKLDVVDDGRSWKAASQIATLAMAGNTTAMGGPMQVLTAATNYHADYVDPKWSKSLTRLTKIGRHIFYSDSPVVVTAGSRKNYI
jgi:hypothetical protein